MSNPMLTNPICSFKFSRKFTSLFWFSSFSSSPLSKTISFLSFPRQPLGVFGVQKGGWGWAGRTGSPPGLGVRAWGTGDSHSLRCWGQGGGALFIHSRPERIALTLCVLPWNKTRVWNMSAKYITFLIESYYLFIYLFKLVTMLWSEAHRNLGPVFPQEQRFTTCQLSAVDW